MKSVLFFNFEINSTTKSNSFKSSSISVTADIFSSLLVSSIDVIDTDCGVISDKTFNFLPQKILFLSNECNALTSFFDILISVLEFRASVFSVSVLIFFDVSQ